MGIERVSWGYGGLQGAKRGYRGYKVLQRVNWGYKGLQGVTSRCEGLRWVT